MRLPENLRNKLKIPLGVLVPDDMVTPETISAYAADASYVITVGDRTTQRLVEFGIIPDLQIVDCQEKRLLRDSPVLPPGTIRAFCTNPAAEITDESISEIKKAFSSASPVRLTVRGEEDLLVIPVCIHAPDGAIVLYGQPDEGMVIVQINDAIRHKTQTLLDSMNSGNDETVAV